MSSSRKALEGEMRKFLSEVLSGIDLVSSLQAHEGNLVNVIKDGAKSRNHTISKICKDALIIMRSGVDCSRALAMSLERTKKNLRSREIVNLLELMCNVSSSTRHLLEDYPNVIAEEFIRIMKFRVKKLFDKLTILLAASFISPIVLALTSLFYKFSMLDAILSVFAFQLLLRWLIKLVFHQSFELKDFPELIVTMSLPLFLALAYVLVSGWLRVIIFLIGLIIVYSVAFRRKEKYLTSEEETFYFELIKGLVVNKSVERVIIELVGKGSCAERSLMYIARRLRCGEGGSGDGVREVSFGVSTALDASLRGKREGVRVVTQLLKTSRMKRVLLSEVALELKTIDFRAKVTATMILISLVLLTFTSVYLLPITYTKLRALCLTYMCATLLFGSSVGFFSLLFTRKRAMMRSFLQSLLFFTVLSMLDLILGASGM